MRQTLTFLLLLAALLACLSTVVAHDFSVSYSELVVNGAELQVRFTFNTIDFHELPLPDNDRDGLISDVEAQPHTSAITAAVLANYAVTAPEPPSRVLVEAQELDQGVLRLNVRYTFNREPNGMRIRSALHRLTQPNHRHLLLVKDATGELGQAVLDAGAPVVDVNLTAATFFENASNFLILGLEHIVTGYDHLAFLAGLLLATISLKNIVQVVTSFTIAHSVTLALATFELVALPGRLIESIIALSIVYVAAENFAGMNLIHRWKLTFLFGLVHGFGFSNILREMELARGTLAISLFSFNLGVELGQLAFVALMLPVLYAVSASRWKEQILVGGSLAIMSLGFYWFVQRAILNM